MRTSSCKAKGRRLCAEIKAMMHKYAPLLHDDDIRVTPSGCTGEDLLLSPAARLVFPITVECKNQESLNIWSALAQAEAHANGTGYIPTMFFKRNRSRLFVALDAEQFVALMSKHKQHNEQHNGRSVDGNVPEPTELHGFAETKRC